MNGASLHLEGAPCARCVGLALEIGPNLIGAAASVGIEHGVTTEQMIAEYMAHLHRDEGHDG